MSLMLGFDLFADDWREQMSREFPALSDEAVRKGRPCVVMEENGKYGVFFDRGTGKK